MPAAILPAALAVVAVVAVVHGAQRVLLAAVVHVGPLDPGAGLLHAPRYELALVVHGLVRLPSVVSGVEPGRIQAGLHLL
eukprot:14882040-Alexandrium_andersonii.AAC.1